MFSTIDDLYKWDQPLYTERIVHRATLWSGYFNYIVRLPSRNSTAVVLNNCSNDKMVAIAHKEITLGCR
jgi:hypothetical protein